MAEYGPPAGGPTPEQARLLAAAFRLLLDQVQPVRVSRLSAATGKDPALVEAELAALSAAGRVQRTGTGEVSGSLGLTLEPTSHAILVNGAALHTWCALDAFGILAALGATGWIESVSPATGHRLHVDVDGGVPRQPPGPWVVFIAERRPVGSVRAEWCPLVNMFEDAESARSWAAARQEAGDALTLTDTAELGKALWQPRIDASLIGLPDAP
jgi:hypothetical protein